MKGKTITMKIGGFRYTSGIGQKVKIYVMAGIQSVDDSETVLINQYILSDVPVYGWKPVKRFKGKTLYFDAIHIKITTLYGIMKILNRAIPEVYKLMRKKIDHE